MRYFFGDYVLDTQCYELQHAGESLKLRRKAFQVLAYLLLHRERVVPKQELLEHVWSDQFVGDEVLKACITALRKALGERGRTPRFVRTLHGQGYRFVAPVEEREHLPAANALPALHRRDGEGTTHQAEGSAPALAPRLADLGSISSEARDGEHKHITVLCGSLADVPALTARLGPESLYRLLQAWLALLQEVVHRYEGTLASSTEEGFMALFGAPTAQEDHARRAVLAALDLRERCHTHMTWPVLGCGSAVTLQLGLHSGLVVAGDLGASSARGYTAVGEATQMALRLQQHAAPGTICLSAATYALVQAEVESAPMDAIEIVGLPAPVPVYTVQGLRQRQAGVTGHGARVRSRFVGRTREMALLQTSLAQVAQGQGQVMGIVGDPGMGKSRLLAEFRRSLAGQSVTYYAGQCLPDGQMTPYLPVRDVVRQHCGLRTTDLPRAVMAAVRRCVQEAGLRPEEATPALLQLLDIPVQDAAFTRLSPEERKAWTFRVLHQLSRVASQRQPLVLAVEDMHWIDATSEAWLARLVERLAGVPMLVLVTYRPGYRPSWLGQSNATQVALPPLTPHDSLLLVQSVLQTATVPEAVGHEIVTKAAGNPFFLEELTWSVRTSGSTHPACTLPTTIQAVLSARLDRLPQAEKTLVQTAAVIGQEVPVPLLQAVADVAEDALPHLLERLQRAEVLYEIHLVPDPVYTFKHALTHEVAYGSLLHERRRALHAQIMAALETLAGDRVAEQVNRLAHHALRGEVWDKALYYYWKAGAMAGVRGAYREAAVCFEQALGALQHLPPSRDTIEQAIDLRFDLRNALFALGEHGPIFEHLHQAETLAQALGDQRRLGWVYAYMIRLFCPTADYDRALASGKRALAIATVLGEVGLQVTTQCLLGQAYYFLGAYARAIDCLRRNVVSLEGQLLREHFGLPVPASLYSRTWLVASLAELGAFAEGSVHGEEEVRIAEAVEQPYSLVQWVSPCN